MNPEPDMLLARISPGSFYAQARGQVMDIGDMRRDFESEGLDRDALDNNPVQQFQNWFGP